MMCEPVNRNWRKITKAPPDLLVYCLGFESSVEKLRPLGWEMVIETNLFTKRKKAILYHKRNNLIGSGAYSPQSNDVVIRGLANQKVREREGDDVEYIRIRDAYFDVTVMSLEDLLLNISRIMGRPSKRPEVDKGAVIERLRANAKSTG